MSKAGRFEIAVRDPHPCWCHLYVDGKKGLGEELLMFHHRDLRDLRYAVDKAMREAKLKLGENSDEV